MGVELGWETPVHTSHRNVPFTEKNSPAGLDGVGVDSMCISGPHIESIAPQIPTK